MGGHRRLESKPSRSVTMSVVRHLFFGTFSQLLCSTDALRELHRTFAERLLNGRNIPTECSLLSECCCGVRGTGATDGVGCSEETPTDVSGAMEEALWQATPGVVASRGGSAQDDSSGKQQLSGFSLKRLIHDLLCCNVPTRVSRGGLPGCGVCGS